MGRSVAGRWQPERQIRRVGADFEEPVVLRDALAPGGGAGFDLAAARTDGQVGDEGVRGFPRPVRDHRAIPGVAAHPQRLKGLGDRADLVDLDQCGVADLGAHRERDDVRGW